jgi:hypothetical protein
VWLWLHVSLSHLSACACIYCRQGFEWDAVDMTDAKQNTEVYELLRDNYVEDDGAMFRFEYAKEFLAWALLAPGTSAYVCVSVFVCGS